MVHFIKQTLSNKEKCDFFFELSVNDLQRGLFRKPMYVNNNVRVGIAGSRVNFYFKKKKLMSKTWSNPPVREEKGYCEAEPLIEVDSKKNLKIFWYELLLDHQFFWRNRLYRKTVIPSKRRYSLNLSPSPARSATFFYALTRSPNFRDSTLWLFYVAFENAFNFTWRTRMLTFYRDGCSIIKDFGPSVLELLERRTPEFPAGGYYELDTFRAGAYMWTYIEKKTLPIELLFSIFRYWLHIWRDVSAYTLQFHNQLIVNKPTTAQLTSDEVDLAEVYAWTNCLITLTYCVHFSEQLQALLFYMVCVQPVLEDRDRADYNDKIAKRAAHYLRNASLMEYFGEEEEDFEDRNRESDFFPDPYHESPFEEEPEADEEGDFAGVWWGNSVENVKIAPIRSITGGAVFWFFLKFRAWAFFKFNGLGVPMTRKLCKKTSFLLQLDKKSSLKKYFIQPPVFASPICQPRFDFAYFNYNNFYRPYLLFFTLIRVSLTLLFRVDLLDVNSAVFVYVKGHERFRVFYNSCRLYRRFTAYCDLVFMNTFDRIEYGLSCLVQTLLNIFFFFDPVGVILVTHEYMKDSGTYDYLWSMPTRGLKFLKNFFINVCDSFKPWYIFLIYLLLAIFLSLDSRGLIPETREYMKNSGVYDYLRATWGFKFLQNLFKKAFDGVKRSLTLLLHFLLSSLLALDSRGLILKAHKYTKDSGVCDYLRPTQVLKFLQDLRLNILDAIKRRLIRLAYLLLTIFFAFDLAGVIVRVCEYLKNLGVYDYLSSALGFKFLQNLFKKNLWVVAVAELLDYVYFLWAYAAAKPIFWEAFYGVKFWVLVLLDFLELPDWVFEKWLLVRAIFSFSLLLILLGGFLVFGINCLFLLINASFFWLILTTLGLMCLVHMSNEESTFMKSPMRRVNLYYSLVTGRQLIWFFWESLGFILKKGFSTLLIALCHCIRVYTFFWVRAVSLSKFAVDSTKNYYCLLISPLCRKYIFVKNSNVSFFRNFTLSCLDVVFWTVPLVIKNNVFASIKSVFFIAGSYSNRNMIWLMLELLQGQIAGSFWWIAEQNFFRPVLGFYTNRMLFLGVGRFFKPARLGFYMIWQYLLPHVVIAYSRGLFSSYDFMSFMFSASERNKFLTSFTKMYLDVLSSDYYILTQPQKFFSMLSSAFRMPLKARVSFEQFFLSPWNFLLFLSFLFRPFAWVIFLAVGSLRTYCVGLLYRVFMFLLAFGAQLVWLFASIFIVFFIFSMFLSVLQIFLKLVFTSFYVAILICVCCWFFWVFNVCRVLLFLILVKRLDWPILLLSFFVSQIIKLNMFFLLFALFSYLLLFHTTFFLYFLLKLAFIAFSIVIAAKYY